jgi:hypothetical protein
MIRRMLTLTAAGAFLMSVAAPVLAQQPAAAPPKADAPKADMAKPDASTAKPAKAATKTATGQLKKVSDTEMVVIVTPKGKNAEDVTFIVEKETKIMKGGKVVGVKDVMEAETVTVTYAEMDGKKTAKQVTSKGAPAAAKKGS